MGVVQSLLALSTISPTLSEQFSALVNLAVVTNVVPYIIALSALFVMMQAGRGAWSEVPAASAVVLVAMLYSTYALYASGKDAVMGGMLVTAIAFIDLGLHRAPLRRKVARGQPGLPGLNRNGWPGTFLKEKRKMIRLLRNTSRKHYPLLIFSLALLVFGPLAGTSRRRPPSIAFGRRPRSHSDIGRTRDLFRIRKPQVERPAIPWHYARRSLRR